MFLNKERALLLIMKRPNKYCPRLEYFQSEELLLSTTPTSKISKFFQRNLNANYARKLAIFIICIFLGVFLMWNNLHPMAYKNNNIGNYELYVKQINMLPNNTFKHYKRQTSTQMHSKRALWDLLGSSKSPSLYTKFMIDDPDCLKVTGKHYKAICPIGNNRQLQVTDCLYHIEYEDKSNSEGAIVKTNVQMRIMDFVTGVGVVHLSEAYLGCSYKDFNPIGEYKDVVDGLLGLSRSPYGIQISFSKAGIPMIFGICFEDYFAKSDETKVGYLYFGNLHDPYSKAQIGWIDFSEEYIFGDETYELRVLELWIDEDISIPMNANLMLDVGAPLTFMETTLFEAIIHHIDESAMDAGYSEYEEEIEHLKCWTFPEPLDESMSTLETISFDFPKLSFKFSNGEALTISPTKYLALYAFVENGVCANMREFDEDIEYPPYTIVLGARMLAEHLIIFDNEKERVGFMPLPKCQFNKKRKFESQQQPSQVSPKRIHINNN